MSAEAAASAPLSGASSLGVAHRDGALDPEARRRTVQVFRLTFGMTASAGIAFLSAWPLSFITPLLVAKLLSLPRDPPLKAGVGLIVILSVSFFLSAWLLLPTARYPAVHLLLMGLILFHLFFAKAGGANPIMVTFTLIGVMAIALVGSVSELL
jgi:hypothetical protein